MHISVIVAHPDSQSFNHAIARTAADQLMKNGRKVHFHDLYSEKFDPILPKEEVQEKGQIPSALRAYCDEISQADGILIVHPNWWGQPPAILKGWVDRVLRPGFAYRFEEGDKGEGIPVGLLKAETALVFNTSNTENNRESQIFGDPLETLWRNCIFQFCGVKNIYRETFSVIVASTEKQRQEWLEKVRSTIDHFFPGT